MKMFKKLQDKGSWPSKKPDASKVQSNTCRIFKRLPVTKSEYRTGQRITPVNGLNAGLWTLFCIFFIFQTNRNFPGSQISLITSIIAGGLVGGLLCAWFTQRQLATLEKKSEIVTTLREIVYLMATGIILVAIIMSVGFNSSTAWLINSYGTSLFAGGIAFFNVRFFLILVWERRKKRQIVQAGFGLYLVIQEPTNKLEPQKDLASEIREKEKLN